MRAPGKRFIGPIIQGTLSIQTIWVATIVYFKSSRILKSIPNPNDIALNALAMEQRNNHILDVTVGHLLSDGSVQKYSEGGNAYFRFKQSIIHQPYFDWNYLIYQPYCTAGSPHYGKFWDARYQTYYESYTLLTKTHPMWNDLRAAFYPGGMTQVTGIKKVIPLDIVIYLSPIALAFWIMGDGHYDNGGIYFNTQDFSRSDLDLLIVAQHSRYGIDAIIRPVTGKSYYRLFVSARFRSKVTQLVQPYMHPSFYYKQGL